MHFFKIYLLQRSRKYCIVVSEVLQFVFELKKLNKSKIMGNREIDVSKIMQICKKHGENMGSLHIY
jgi:hypothetical protein